VAVVHRRALIFGALFRQGDVLALNMVDVYLVKLDGGLLLLLQSRFLFRLFVQLLRFLLAGTFVLVVLAIQSLAR